MHTRDISGLGVPVWSARPDSTWEARFCLGQTDACQPLDPDNAAHVEWQQDNAAGYGWYVTTLPLWSSK